MSPEAAFGAVLKKVRRDVGLSQEKLALAAGLDRTFISMLERGVRQPSLSSILILSTHLDIAPDILIRKTVEAMDENQ